MKVYLVMTRSKTDGGFLPDSIEIQGIFSSDELAKEYIKKVKKEFFENLEIKEYELDELLGEKQW